MSFAGWLVASYLLGAIPTSFVAAKYLGCVDLRRGGSGNLGATNLYRALGWRFAIPVALFDIGKGAVPILAFGPQTETGSPWTPVMLGCAAVVGHVYSVFVRFRG